MRLLRDLLLIRPDEGDAEETTQSGIVVVKNHPKSFTTGTVVAIGQYTQVTQSGATIPVGFEPGDKVVYRRGGEDFSYEGETVKLTNVASVCGILDPVNVA